MPSDIPRMSPLFQTHQLNEQGLTKAAVIAEHFNALLFTMEGLCTAEPSKSGMLTLTREFAIVRSKLEEACFYAKKAMASLPFNQE